MRRAANAAKAKATKFAKENELDRKAERLKRTAKLKYMEVEEERAKDTADDVKRKWPYIKRRLDDFADTSVGKVFIFAGFFMFLSSGLIFPLLNLLFIFWWIAPLVVVPVLNYMAKKMEEESTTNQQDAFANNPFGRSPFATKKGRQDFSSGGPVIDVDHETVDD
eukprot:jgi/Pico_ML_1/54212/g4618.t1